MKNMFILAFLFLSAFTTQAQNWKTDFEIAKKEAAETNRTILLVFSGSDWCAPCMKLEKNIWNSDLFKKESADRWVLLRADFPKKKANQLSAEQTEKNKKLAEKYNREGNFPLVVMLDKNGKVLGMTGFKNVSAEEYIKLLNSLVKS